MGALRRDLSAGYARRRPIRSFEDAGSIPATSKSSQGSVSEGCWRCACARVTLQNLDCPSDCVGYANSGRLRTDPEFQIPWAVVVADTVDVVDGLVRKELASEQLLHDKDVFEYIAARSSPWVPRESNHQIPSVVSGTSTFPVTVEVPILSAAA